MFSSSCSFRKKGGNQDLASNPLNISQQNLGDLKPEAGVKPEGDSKPEGAGASHSAEGASSKDAGKIAGASGTGTGSGAGTQIAMIPSQPSTSTSSTSTAVTPAQSANGTATGIGSTAQTPVTSAAPAAPKEPEQTCFVITYKHKALASHGSEEACSRHKNLIKIKHKKVNLASLCLRVNGRPVHYQAVKGKQGEFLIGPVAGPKSTITASYCLGKQTCNEECKVPKDEFMDAIGGGDGEDSQGGLVGQWDPTDTGAQKLNAELKKELAELDESGSAAADNVYVFNDWVSDPETPVCGKKQVVSQLTGNK